ncbi:MAG: alanine-zipper protein [Pseudomonadota bacterium]
MKRKATYFLVPLVTLLVLGGCTRLNENDRAMIMETRQIAINASDKATEAAQSADEAARAAQQASIAARQSADAAARSSERSDRIFRQGVEK